MRNRIEYDIRAKDSFSKPMGAFKRSLTQITRNMKPTNAGMAKVQAQLRKTGNSFKNITLDANRANTSFKQLNGVFIGLRGAIGTIGMYRLARGLGGAIQSAMDMVEVQNLFAVSMGESADSANELLGNISQITGLDYTGLQSATGTFALLSRSMGIATEDAEVLSTTMARLSLDLASLTNVPINQVMQDLRSGLVGQSETVYKYGLDVTEASLKQEAMNQGISKSVRNMSQGEKMALRYAVMIRQSALAQGDFAKTIEQPANQVRILTERMTTLARSIGTIFMPMIGAVLPYLNAVVQLLTQWANAIARIVGYEPEEAVGSLGQIGAGASDATDDVEGLGKALDKLSGGFDELNVLSESSGSGGSGVSVGGTADFDFPTYDSMLSSIKQKSDAIMQDMSDKMETVFGWLDKVTEPIQLALPELGEGIMQTWEWLYNDVLKPIGEWTVSEGIPVFFEAVASAISTMGTALTSANPYLKSFTKDFLNPIGKFAGDTFIDWLEKFTELMEDLQSIMEGDMSLGELSTGQKVALGAGLGLVVANLAKLFVPLGATQMSKGMLPVAGGLLTKLTGLSTGKLLLLGGIFGGSYKMGYDTFSGDDAPFKEQGDTLFGIMKNAFDSFKEGSLLLVDEVSTIPSMTIDPIKNAIESFVSGTIEGVDAIKSIFTETEAIDSFTESGIEKMQNFFGTVEGFADLLKQEGERQRNEMTTPWDSALGEMGLSLDSFSTQAEIAYSALFGNLKSTTETEGVGVKSSWGNVMNTLRAKLGLETKNMESDHDKFLTNIATQASKAKPKAEREYSLLFKGLQGVVNPIIDAMTGKFSGFISLLNGIKSKVEETNRLEVNVPQIPAFQSGTMRPTQFARGGMVERGMLFQAGEAGAELLGSYGGKQTVMPLENSGFVESMYQAVYNAVSSAQGQGGSVIENVVELDGEVIYRNQQKVERNRGKNFNMGAFAR